MLWAAIDIALRIVGAGSLLVIAVAIVSAVRRPPQVTRPIDPVKQVRGAMENGEFDASIARAVKRNLSRQRSTNT